MYYNINLSKLYEQSSSNKNHKLFAFPIDDAIKAQLDSIISKGSGEFKSTSPLNIMGTDGSIGVTGMLNNKPVYLWISISENKKGQAKLELEDRNYLILDTTAKNLKALLDGAEGKDNRKRAFVKSQDGSEFSVELWKEIQHDAKSVDSDQTSDVGVDLKMAQEYPGTAPISGTVAEGAMNEQGDAKFDIMQRQLNKEALSKTPKSTKPKTEKKDNLTASQRAVISGLGEASKNNIIKRKDGTFVVYAKVKGLGTAYFYNNDRFSIKKEDGTLVKGSYANGGKSLKLDKGKTVTKSNPWEVLKSMIKTKPTEVKTQVQLKPTGFDQAAGNKFREWANSTPELKSKYGKDSKFDLDPKGKPDNSFIRKAYAAAKDEYSKYLKDSKLKETVKTGSKYKEGQVIYYKIDSTGKAKEIEVKSDSKPKYQPSERELAYAKSNESIVTKFEDYLSITEEEDVPSGEVDAQMSLIKDIKSGKIKKGIIRKIISKDDLKVEDLETEKIETIKASNILKTEDVKLAKEKLSKSAKEEKDKASGETKSKLDQEKEDTESAKQELKNLKKKKRDIKKSKRKSKKVDRKIKKEDKKQERISKKIKKQSEKVDSLKESRLYTFNEFIKK